MVGVGVGVEVDMVEVVVGSAWPILFPTSSVTPIEMDGSEAEEEDEVEEEPLLMEA